MTNVISKVIHNWTEYEFNGVNGWVTSVNGNTWAVTVNDVKVSATAPSNPTEWMAWYDTTNDALKVYDGSNWIQTWAVTSVNNQTWAVTVNDTKVASSAPTATEWTLWYDSANDKLKAYNGSSWDEIWWWITKIFTLSSTSDLTNAQAAYDWYVNGWNPIIYYSTTWVEYHLQKTASNYLAFASNAPTIWNSSYDIFGSRMIQLAVSSWTVTSINQDRFYVRVQNSAPTSWDNKTVTLVI